MVKINSTDYWFKVVEMLQQNWALIDRDADSDSCTVFFIHDGSGVFDKINFRSEIEAHIALERNGFARYIADPEAMKFISPPKPPFFKATHPNGPIYSSGRFWY